MKNRKRGFSLVELLIVLAVIAALIATITPVAMNAIRKSQATKVAQNLKTLASAFENYVYVNSKAPDDFTDLGRDIDEKKYNALYETDNGAYTVTIITSESVHTPTVEEVLKGAKFETYSGDTTGTLNDKFTDDVTIWYQYSFESY